jgi:hypothetical protein
MRMAIDLKIPERLGIHKVTIKTRNGMNIEDLYTLDGLIAKHNEIEAVLAGIVFELCKIVEAKEKSQAAENYLNSYLEEFNSMQEIVSEGLIKKIKQEKEVSRICQ